jgi:hypothetical protein
VHGAPEGVTEASGVIESRWADNAFRPIVDEALANGTRDDQWWPPLGANQQAILLAYAGFPGRQPSTVPPVPLTGRPKTSIAPLGER